MDLVRLLLNTYLFQDLTPAELEPIARLALVRTYRRGEFVFRVGDPSLALHVVAAGQLKESVVTADGDEIVTEIFTVGAVFGEPGLFSQGGGRVVDVEAMQSSEVVSIARKPLIDFLLSHPPAVPRMLEGLAAQARTTVEDLSNVAFRSIQERLVVKLLELSETHGEREANGTTIRLHLSQATLAAMIGASRENVNRALNLLAEVGEVRPHANQVVLLDLPALYRRAGQLLPSVYRRNRLIPSS